METIERTEPVTAPAQRETFQPQDVLKQVVISTLAVAPDASSIVYVRRTVENGKYARRLWRTTFAGGAPDQLTSAAASDTRPRYSPDSRSLLFISDRTGKPQAWVMPLSGGEARQLTDLPGGVGAADWSPDGQIILLVAGSGEKRFIVGKEDDPTARRIRDYTWRFDGVGVRDEFNSAWMVDAQGGKPLRLTAPTYNVEVAVWSPDGKQIAFIADLSESAGLEEHGAVWTISTEGGDPKKMAALEGAVFNLAWALSANAAFIGTSRPDLAGWADFELHVTDGKKSHRLAADRHLNISVTSSGDFTDGRFPPPVIWEDETHILALVAHRGCSHPYRFGLDGKVESLAEPEAVCGAIATGGGRTAVVASASQPSDVYTVENGALRRLTAATGSGRSRAQSSR
jgi:dipeptidyl aminopeptidase/acylaminoacyl peptidase